MKKTKLLSRTIVLALFAFYMYALLRVILFKFYWRDLNFLMDQLQMNLANPDYLISRLQSGNFIPFKTILINMNSLSGWHDFSNLVGNIVAFIPFGMFLLLLPKNKELSFIGAFVRSFSLTLCLECLQVVFSLGIFDVDDLILNTFGGMLGYFALRLMTRFTANTSSVAQDREMVEKQEFNNF